MDFLDKIARKSVKSAAHPVTHEHVGFGARASRPHAGKMPALPGFAIFGVEYTCLFPVY